MKAWFCPWSIFNVGNSEAPKIRQPPWISRPKPANRHQVQRPWPWNNGPYDGWVARVSKARQFSMSLRFLNGGGAMGALIRAHDWASTPLGRPTDWPQPLKTIVGVMLGANQAMFVAWGPQQLMFYNDLYAD